ncbi:Agenet-like domain [Macleaya cordata]|uniref:Agenet-like domain n=1 Tax=Macleaya cordata TaxID=56857 RepID=A0A200PXN8_MACCD|nr:Agenet-like domain [Macleaya cordata]
MEFRHGERVEISIKQKDFYGSYYTEKFLSRVGLNKFLVEYETLRSNRCETSRITDIVDAPNVRHFPPEVKVTDFSLHDIVDAYENDAWWVGTISEIINSTNYYVYFENTGEIFAYPNSDLRVHQELVNGNWVVSHKKGLK